MVPKHSRISAKELASALGVDVTTIQVDCVIQTDNGWVALVPVDGFLDSPDMVNARLRPPDPDLRPWWKKITGGMKQWPSTGWMVAAELTPDSWIWLGGASCYSWSEQADSKVLTGHMALETRIPRELFMQLRGGNPWIDCGGGLELDGSFDTAASERLRLIMKEAKGDVFLQRWEGEIFGLQFDEERSVFFVMPEGMNSTTYQYAACPEASCEPEADTKRIDMHCPCCGIENGAFLPELHMSREFGFFVLSWLLDHNELPLLWPTSGQPAVEWRETDTLAGV